MADFLSERARSNSNSNYNNARQFVNNYNNGGSTGADRNFLAGRSMQQTIAGQQQPQVNPLNASNSREMTGVESALANIGRVGEDIMNIGGFNQAYAEKKQKAESENRDMNLMDYASLVPSFGASLVPMMVGGLIQDVPRAVETVTGDNLLDADVENNRISTKKLTGEQQLANAGYLAGDFLSFIPGMAATKAATTLAKAGTTAAKTGAKVEQSVLKQSAKTIGGSMLEEGGAEAFQQPMEEIRGDLNTYGVDSVDWEGLPGRALEAGAWGALGGGIFGGANVAMSYASDKLNGDTPNVDGVAQNTVKEPVSPFYAEKPDTDTFTSYAKREMASQYDTNKTPGTSAVVQGGTIAHNITGINDANIGIDAIRGMLSNSKSRGYVVNQVLPALGLTEDDLRNDNRNSQEEWMQQEKAIAQKLTDAVNERGGFEMVIAKNPHNVRGLTKVNVKGFNAGNVIYAHRNAVKALNSDTDGDMFQMYAESNDLLKNAKYVSEHLTDTLVENDTADLDTYLGVGKSFNHIKKIFTYKWNKDNPNATEEQNKLFDFLMDNFKILKEFLDSKEDTKTKEAKRDEDLKNLSSKYGMNAYSNLGSLLNAFDTNFKNVFPTSYTISVLGNADKLDNVNKAINEANATIKNFYRERVDDGLNNDKIKELEDMGFFDPLNTSVGKLLNFKGLPLPKEYETQGPFRTVQLLFQSVRGSLANNNQAEFAHHWLSLWFKMIAPGTLSKETAKTQLDAIMYDVHYEYLKNNKVKTSEDMNAYLNHMTKAYNDTASEINKMWATEFGIDGSFTNKNAEVFESCDRDSMIAYIQNSMPLAPLSEIFDDSVLTEESRNISIDSLHNLTNSNTRKVSVLELVPGLEGCSKCVIDFANETIKARENKIIRRGRATKQFIDEIGTSISNSDKIEDGMFKVQYYAEIDFNLSALQNILAKGVAMRQGARTLKDVLNPNNKAAHAWIGKNNEARYNSMFFMSTNDMFADLAAYETALNNEKLSEEERENISRDYTLYRDQIARINPLFAVLSQIRAEGTGSNTIWSELIDIDTTWERKLKLLNTRSVDNAFTTESVLGWMVETFSEDDMSTASTRFNDARQWKARADEISYDNLVQETEAIRELLKEIKTETGKDIVLDDILTEQILEHNLKVSNNMAMTAAAMQQNMTVQKSNADKGVNPAYPTAAWSEQQLAAHGFVYSFQDQMLGRPFDVLTGDQIRNNPLVLQRAWIDPEYAEAYQVGDKERELSKVELFKDYGIKDLVQKDGTVRKPTNEEWLTVLENSPTLNSRLRQFKVQATKMGGATTGQLVGDKSLKQILVDIKEKPYAIKTDNKTLETEIRSKIKRELSSNILFHHILPGFMNLDGVDPFNYKQFEDRVNDAVETLVDVFYYYISIPKNNSEEKTEYVNSVITKILGTDANKSSEDAAIIALRQAFTLFGDTISDSAQLALAKELDERDETALKLTAILLQDSGIDVNEIDGFTSEIPDRESDFRKHFDNSFSNFLDMVSLKRTFFGKLISMQAYAISEINIEGKQVLRTNPADTVNAQIDAVIEHIESGKALQGNNNSEKRANLLDNLRTIRNRTNNSIDEKIDLSNYITDALSDIGSERIVFFPVKQSFSRTDLDTVEKAVNAIHDEYLIDIPFNRSEYEKMDDAELDAKLKELSLSANTQIHSDFVGKTAGGVDDIYSDYYALTIDIANSFKKLFNEDFEKFDPESQIPENKKANKDLILAKLNFDISKVDNAFLATMSPTTVGTGNVAPGVSSDNIPNKYDAGYTAIPSNIVCKNVNEDAVVINASDISYLNAYDYVGIVDDNGTVSWHALTENLAAELKASRSVKDLNIGSSKLISSGLTLNIDNNTQVLVVDPIEHSKHCNHVGCCFCSSAPKLRSEEGTYNPLRKALQLISDFCEPRQLQAKKSLAGLDKLDKQISGDGTFYQKSKFDKSMFSQDGTRINKSIFDAKCSGIRSSMQKRLHQVLTDKQNKKLGFDANGSTSESNMLAANMCQRVVLYDSEGNGRFFSLDTISSWPVENGQYVVPEGLSFSSGRVSPFTFTSLGSFIADAIDKEIEQNPNGYKGDGHINYEEVVGNALKTLDGTAGEEAISFRELEAYTPLVPDAGFTGVGYDYSSAWRNLVKAQKYIDSLTPKSEFNVKSLSQLSKEQQEEYERYKKYGQQYNIYPNNEKIAVKVFGKIDKRIDSNIGNLASEVNGNKFLKQNNLLAKNHYALVLDNTDIKEAVAWSNATGSSLLIERSMYNTLKGTNAFAGFREGFSFGDKTSFVEITPLLDENYYAGLHSGMKVSALKCDPNSDVMEIYAEQNIMGSTDSQSYLNPFAKLIKRLRQPLTGSFNISVPKETQLKTSYQTSIIKKRSDIEKFLIRDDNGNVRGLDWIKDEKNIEELVKYYQNIGVELTNNTGTLKQNQYTLASPREVARQLFVFAHRVCTEGSTDFSEDRGCLTKNIVREDCVGVIDYFHINEDGTRSHIYQPAIIQGSGPSYLTSARLDINNDGCTVTYSFTNDSVLAEKDGDATKMTNYFGAAMKALGYIVDEKFGALFPTLSFKDYASTYNENISVDILSDPYVTGSRIVTDDMRKQRMLTNFGTAQTHMGGMLFLQKDESTGRWIPREKLGKAFQDKEGNIDIQKVIGLYTNKPYTTMKQLLEEANAVNGGIVEFFDPDMENARYYNKIITHLFLRNAKIGSDASIRGLLSSYEFELHEDGRSFQPISRRTVRPDYHSLMSKLNMNECSLFFNLLNTYDGKKICENVLTDTQRNENALFTADGRMYVEMPKYVIKDGNPTIINSQPEPVEVFWGQKNFNIERTDEMENLGETNLSYQHIYKAGWEYGYSETFADSIGYFQSSLNNWDAAWLDYEGSMQKRFVKTADGSTKEWIPQVLSDKESYDIYTDPELTLREKSHTASLREAAKIFTTGVRIVDENNNTIPDGNDTVENAIGSINSALGIENSSKKISRTIFQNWILPSYLGITYGKDVTPVVYLTDLPKHVNAITESIKEKGLVIPKNIVDSSSKSYGSRYSVPFIPEDIARYLYSVSPTLTNKHATFEDFQIEMAKEWNTQYEDIAAIQDRAKKNEILKLARYAKKTSTNPDIEVAGATEFYADTYFEDLIEADENLLKIMYKMDDAQVEFAKSELKRIQNTMKEIAKHKNSDNFNSYVDKKGKAHITYKGKNIDFVTAFCKNASALTKIMAVLNPMIAAANVTERVASQGVMNAALYAGTVGVGPYRVTNNKNYKVDGQIELVKHACTNEGAKELYASWRFLELTGYQGGMPRSRAELNALMEDHLSKQNKLQKTSESIWNIVSGKDFAISGQMQAFVNQYIRRLGLAAEEGNVLAQQWFEPISENDSTTKIEWYLKNDPEHFFEEVMLTLPNRDIMTLSMNWARGADKARKTAFGMVYQEIADNHPIFEFFTTTNISRFIQYQSNLMESLLQWVFPVSSVRFLWNKTLSQLDIPIVGSNKKLSDLHLEDAQVHANMREAIMVDCCHISLGFMAAMLVAMSGAIEPPDDEDKWNNKSEWTVLGMRVTENWWLSDLLGPAIGMACFMKSVQMGKPCLPVLVNDIVDSMYSNPMLRVGDILQELTNPWESAAARYYEDVDKASGLVLSDITPVDALTSDAAAYGVNWLTQFITPSALKQIYNDMQEYEVSYKKVAKTDQYGNVMYNQDGTVQYENTTYYDAQLRKISRKNPVLGFLLDTFIYPDAPTGYMADEMPRTVYYDPAQIDSLKMYSLYTTDENGNTVVKSEKERQAIALSVIGTMMSYENMEDLTRTGFCLPYDTLQYVADCVWDIAYGSTNAWDAYYNSPYFSYADLGDGDSELGKKKAEMIQEAVNQDYYFWSSFYYNKLKDDAITAGIATYNRYNTTYAQDMNGEWYATGYRPSYFMPIITAPGTLDMPGETMGYGNDWTTRSIVTNDTTGQRALIPNLESYDLGKFESHAASGNGSGYSKSYARYGRSGGGGGRSGGGGGRGAYFTSGSKTASLISPNRVSTTYKSHGGKQYGYNVANPVRTTQPTLDYLRPQFETKGSRKPYRRTDF